MCRCLCNMKKSCLWIFVGLFILSLIANGILAYMLIAKDTQPAEFIQPTPIPPPTPPENKEVRLKPDPSKPWTNPRLPLGILPLEYDLTLHPDLEAGTFSGRVRIDVKVERPTYHILVHSDRLLVYDLKLMGNNREVEIKNSFEYAPNHYFVVESKDLIGTGTYNLTLLFNGSLTAGGIVGFYRSKYFDSATGKARYLASSKFQPTYARRAFPCFDEPNFKTPYTVTLIHEKGYNALSNMPIKESIPRTDGLIETRFERSVPMVTYLACFVVCDFPNTTTTTKDGKPFSVFARPDQIENTRYATKLGSEIQDYFARYFGVEYPLPKQDMIAIPEFPSGAMEHWGLITYRESNLLQDEAISSTYQKQRVAVVISHELAHQWFGNLVTMKWWDGLWLNEGFASFIEYKGVAEFEKDWHIMAQALVEDVQSVMGLDASTMSHPIIQPVEHPDQITEIFDSITYAKGTSVLRMLEFVLGEDQFRKGVQVYLKKYKYGSTITQNLWDELTLQSRIINVTSFMDTWTKQMGFPVIRLQRDPTNPNIFELTQERFLSNPKEQLRNNVTESPFRYLWEVPISYINPASGLVTIQWMHRVKSEKIMIKEATNDIWPKLNLRQTGFYRVNYPLEGWRYFTDTLNSGNWDYTAEDRANLINDAFTLASAGHLNFSVALELSKYLSKEHDYLPWRSYYDQIEAIISLLSDWEMFPQFSAYVTNLARGRYEELAWKESGSHLQKLERNYIIKLMCRLNDADCLKTCRQYLDKFIKNDVRIPSDIMSSVMRFGVSSSSDTGLWETLWERYENSTSDLGRSRILYGLAFTRHVPLIHRYLRYSMDESKVKRQDFFIALQYLSRNEVALPYLWDFLRATWPQLVARFSLNDRYLGRTVSFTTSSFHTDLKLNEMEAFFLQYREAGAGAMARKQALAQVKRNIAWLEANVDDIKVWLLK